MGIALISLGGWLGGRCDVWGVRRLDVDVDESI